MDDVSAAITWEEISKELLKIPISLKGIIRTNHYQCYTRHVIFIFASKCANSVSTASMVSEQYEQYLIPMV